METVIVKNNYLRLPNNIADKLRGMQIEISEFEGGVILKARINSIAEARGFLKGKKFSSERYFEMKRAEKELES